MTSMPPGYQMTGAATYDRSILEHLALLGVEVHAILPKGSQWIESNGAARRPVIHRIGIPLQPPFAFHAVRILALPRVVRALHERYTFNCLRVHSFFSSCLEALWITADSRLSLPMVVHFHHLDNSPWRNVLVRQVMRRAKAVIAFSHAAKEQAVQHLGVQASKIHVVYHGVGRELQPAPPKKELLESIGWKHGERILLYLGSLESRKNPLFLLDVLADLLSQRQTVRLVLCGAGPLAETLRREIQRRGLESHACLTGPVPERLKADYYNLADVFLFPSGLEGFGLSLAEAMSCGKPVVAFDNSSISEVVERGQTGFLVESGDRNEFVRSTTLLLENDSLHAEMGCRARERVERLFRWDRAAQQTLDVYTQALASPGFKTVLEPAHGN
ncbi:MAG: glycosyltransferase family 4 protein [Candidatus Acidiferrales bacterium]